MEIALIVTAGVLIALAVVAFFLTRSLQSGIHTSVKTLQEGLDRFQTQLFAQQKEFERTEEMKSTNLRSEIAQQLQTNRQELQQGLQQSSQSLEARFGVIDSRLDHRLKELTEGVQTKLEANLKEGFHHFSRVEDA